jgi:hypothetical protein
MMTKKSIQFGSIKIEYKLSHSDRKTLGITVTPELEVIVKAPAGTMPTKVDEIVRKRADWILKQQGYFLSFFPKQPHKKYISGETHLYLGKQYRLRIHKRRKESVRLTGRFIEVYCSRPERAKQLLKNWYFDRAEEKFDSYLQKWLGSFKRYKVSPTAIVIREMPKRWGSCTPIGKILLNPQLIKSPRGCIEYVIVHELCHLVHHNHTQKFMDLQLKLMPQWEKWKTRLEQLLA